MLAELPGYVAIEGPVGVGKTSLARRLSSHFETELLLEQPQDNPFLERFYQDPGRMALPTQLSFLFQRVRQLEDLQHGDLFRERLVADFLLDKDRLFARLTLDADELQLYEEIYSRLEPTVPRADLVVYLQAPVPVLMRRIQRRGRSAERGIDPDYLESLCQSYAQFFHYYQDSPLLIVNTASINPVDNQEDYEALIERICRTTSGRNFYNPMPELI